MKVICNKKIIYLFFGAVLFFTVGFRAVQAAPALEVISDTPLFNIQNAAPGQQFSSPVTILNHGGNNEKFQFELDMKTNPAALAEHLFFKIDDNAGNCLYGCGTDVSVKSLDRSEIIISKIGPHSTNKYNFILTFDSNAGNEFQSAATTFDMKIGFHGGAANVGRGGGGGGGNGGGGGGGAGPTGVIGGAAAGAAGGGAVAGAEAAGTAGQQAGQVAGEENAPGQVEGASVETCQSWPKWIWILLLIAYFILFLWRTFSHLSKQIEKREIRWRWQAVLAVSALLVWYLFDKCREFQWFVIAAIVGGAVIYLFYLYLFRKNIRKNHADIESGSGEMPPGNQDPPKGPEA